MSSIISHSGLLNVITLTLKSIPTVAIKLPPRNAPSLKRTKRHVFPTAESPSSITCSKPTSRERDNRLQRLTGEERHLHETPNKPNLGHVLHQFFCNPAKNISQREVWCLSHTLLLLNTEFMIFYHPRLCCDPGLTPSQRWSGGSTCNLTPIFQHASFSRTNRYDFSNSMCDYATRAEPCDANPRTHSCLNMTRRDGLTIKLQANFSCLRVFVCACGSF